MTNLGKISNNYVVDTPGGGYSNKVEHSKTKDLQQYVEPVEVTSKLDAFLKYVSDAFTPTMAYAASSTIDIPEIGEVEFEHYVNNNEGVSVFYFYNSESPNESLTIAGDYTMSEIMNKFGKNAKYYRVDMSYFSDDAKRSVIDYMGKNKFPCYLIVNKMGTHANTFKIKGAEHKNTPGAVELKKIINEAYEFVNRKD